MKKTVSIMMVLLLVLTLFTGCTKRGVKPDSDKEPGKHSASNFPNMEDNPKVVVKKSTPPENFPETHTPDTLIVAQEGEPNTLFPLDGNQIPAEIAIRPMYELLINYNQFTGEFEPQLAEKWEMINDTTIRIYLRKGIKCHAGYEMTADDVKWTMKMGQENPVSACVWGCFDYENTKVVDKYTIDIATPKPCGFLLYSLSDGSLGYIINQKAYEEVPPEDYARHPTGGTGPYKIVDWIASDRIIYERNEDYWGEKPYYKNLIIRRIADNVTRSMSLESGEVDIALNIDSSSYDTLVDSPLTNVVEFPAYWLIKLGLNNSAPPFNDVNVRRAIRYALDLESMVNIAFTGLADVGDSCWPNALSVYAPPSEELSYKYNPEKAKDLLKQAGYDENNPLTFDLHVANIGEWVQLAEMIHNALEEIGVMANVIPMDHNMLLDKAGRGDYQAEISRFSSASDNADEWYFRLYSKNGFQDNRVQYKNEEVDRLLDEARCSLDANFRMECYRKVQQYFREDLPWISLACPRMIHGIRSTLDGLEPHPYGISDFRYVHPINP